MVMHCSNEVPSRLVPMTSRFKRAGIAVLVQDADIADQVDIAAPVGLIFRRSRSLLHALAITDMHMPDTVDHCRNRLDWILARAVNMRRIHVQGEVGRGDVIQNLEAGRRIVDIIVDMRL